MMEGRPSGVDRGMVWAALPGHVGVEACRALLMPYRHFCSADSSLRISLIAARLSPRAVVERLGHADPSETLRTYAHLWPSDEARILEAIDDTHGSVTDRP